MAQGTPKWVNEARGYGFITPDGGGADDFAHFFEVQASAFRRLQENQRVEFLVKEGRKGTQAGQIRPI